ncbi:MAG: hypothetical protein U0R44_04715 [Candidatus Micrarchaeia archaeon]
MNAEFEFQKRIFLKHIRFFVVLFALLIVSALLGLYFRFNDWFFAYLFVGALSSFLASLVFVYPDARDHFFRQQYKLLAIAEMSMLFGKELSRSIGKDVLDTHVRDEELRKLYAAQPTAQKVRAFMPGFVEKLDLIVLSSPELEVGDWEALYHAKRDLDVQSGLPAGANDLLFIAKALRMMDRIGERSIYFRKRIKK